MDHRNHVEELFERYLTGKASPEETTELLIYFETSEGARHLKELMENNFDRVSDHDHQLLSHVGPMADRVGAKLNLLIKEHSLRLPFWRRGFFIGAVAAIIALAMANYLYIQNVSISEELHNRSLTKIDADAGTNRATLILSDGRKIDLEHTNAGTIVNQHGLEISKTTDGQIIYTVNDNSQQTGDNTIATPKGGTYQVRLPDGSKVWLNAASTLTYATDMSNSKKRQVELGGEAYFEVAKDALRPFIVKTGDQYLKVLGTHFNINGYGDQAEVITTLAEGAVEIYTPRMSKLLKPGQQSVLQGSNLKIEEADVETELAWKDGNMVFKSEPLENIMKDVERWYNVKVVYEGQVRTRVFSGGMSRTSKLSSLLKLLEYNNIHFELREDIHGKTLIVKP